MKSKKAVANLAKFNYYNPAKDTQIENVTRVTAVLGPPSAKKQRRWIGCQWLLHHGIWIPQEKNYWTNELELLAVVWAMDRFKLYLLGREFTIATDNKSLTSALGEDRSNKTYQSRLTRQVIDCYHISSRLCIYAETIWVQLIAYQESQIENRGQSLNLIKSSW